MADADVVFMPDTSEPLLPARSLKEVRALIRRIGARLRTRANRKRKLEEKIDKCKQELARLGANLDSSRDAKELHALATPVYLYCENEQEELERIAKGRTISFPDGGEFGWRDGPAKLPDINDDDLLRMIRKAGLMRQLVTYKPEINRKKLVKEPELLEKLGIELERKTIFRIEPPETDERMEAESGTKNPVWEIRKPKSRAIA